MSQQTSSASAPSAGRARYFWIGQACTLLCFAIFVLLAVTRSSAVLLLLVPAVLALFVLLAAQGFIAALVGSIAPAVPKARVVAAGYGAIAVVTLLTFSSGAMKDHRKQQADTLESARDWSEFEAALDPWPLPVPDEALAAIGAGCVQDRMPPVQLFTTVATRSDVQPTLLTIVAATCGSEYTQWALAHGGSVVPKHDVAPSPLAYARDDEVFALLRAAGAGVDQRDPAFPRDPTPLFYAHDAAAIRRLHDAGANVLYVDGNGNSALHGADWKACELWCRTLLARRADASIVAELVGLGLPVDAKNAEGETPLCRNYQDADVVRLLLGHGANPYAKHSLGGPIIDRVNKELVAQLRAEGLIPDSPGAAAP